MKRLIILALAVSAGACTDTSRARLGSFGDRQTVCMYAADGRLIGKWVSTGKVDSEGSLHFFNDSATDKYVKVSGSVVVSAADMCKQ